MVSSFPKMQKSSASFSQSIRNRLRLKKLQAQAKNFCRVLDIRVPKIMKANFLQTIFLKKQIKMLRNEIWLDQFTHGIYIDIVQIIFTVAVTTHRTVNTLLCSEITEQQLKRCNKWKCTATRFRLG